MMEKLDTFEGGDGLVFTIPEPKLYTHDAWAKGINSASGSRSLRIVMPLAMFVDIVENADLSIFSSEAGGVECWPRQLQFPNHDVIFLNTKWDRFQITQVQRDLPAHSRKIHCKTIELPLNYHERMVRYQFRVPPKHDSHGRILDDEKWRGKCKRYLKKWIELIIAEKKRQMHAPEKMWPPWPPRSEVKDVMTMPMVIWLSKPKKPTAVLIKRNSGFFQSGDYSC